MSLEEQRCQPCRQGDPALSLAEAQRLLAELPGWELAPEGKELRRLFLFKAYLDALPFVEAVARMAQAEDHHPDIELGYKKALVRWSTHAVKGLSINDFICAAKSSRLAP